MNSAMAAGYHYASYEKKSGVCVYGPGVSDTFSCTSARVMDNKFKKWRIYKAKCVHPYCADDDHPNLLETMWLYCCPSTSCCAGCKKPVGGVCEEPGYKIETYSQGRHGTSTGTPAGTDKLDVCCATPWRPLNQDCVAPTDPAAPQTCGGYLRTTPVTHNFKCAGVSKEVSVEVTSRWECRNLAFAEGHSRFSYDKFGTLCAFGPDF